MDVSKRTQEITLFGQKQKMPIVVAPTGLAGLMWYEGELALARAAKAAGIPFTIATGSLTSMERVAAEVGGRLWFQLYMWANVALSHELVHRAKDAGYEAHGEGLTLSDNPHPTDTRAHLDWQNGWSQARDETLRRRG